MSASKQARNNRPLFGRAKGETGQYYFCSIDPGSYTVIRRNKAARLGLVGFTIFKALHEAPVRTLKTSVLVDRVYNGSIDPGTRNSVNSSIYYVNNRIRRLGLRIRGVNRRQNSFYQIVEIR